MNGVGHNTVFKLLNSMSEYGFYRRVMITIKIVRLSKIEDKVLLGKLTFYVRELLMKLIK